MNDNKNNLIYDSWLVWTITNACNLNCTYCNASDPEKIVKKLYYLGFLNSAKIVTVNLGKLIEQSSRKGLFRVYRETKAKLTPDARTEIDIPALKRTLDASQKIFKISFTGGEPFLVPNFIEACNAITKKHYITLFSNLTSSEIRRFSNSIDPRKVLEICGSLHIKELERMRLLDRYIENFRLLKDDGFNVKAEVVAYPDLLGDVEKYRLYFKGKGIHIEFVPFRGKYRWKQYPKFYSRKEIEIFGFKTLHDSHADVSDDNIIGCFYRKGKSCNAGYNAGVVFPSGDIQTCFLIDQSLGNVFSKIEFSNHLIKCPFQYCSCPLNMYDPYLFEKACRESKLS